MDKNEYRPKPIDLEERPNLDDYSSMEDDDLFHEETASELVDHDAVDLNYDDVDEDDEDMDLQSVYGWTAVALSVISFFLLPFILAVAGIVVGVFARAKSAPILGNTAIVIGALSIIVRLFIMPFI